MPVHNPWPEPQNFAPPPVEHPRRVFVHNTQFPNANPFPPELEPYQGYYAERYGNEYIQDTKSLELELERDIEKQKKDERAETEKLVRQLEKNNDPCLRDAFETAKKVKEIKSGRISLDSDKTIQDELDEF